MMSHKRSLCISTSGIILTAESIRWARWPNHGFFSDANPLSSQQSLAVEPYACNTLRLVGWYLLKLNAHGYIDTLLAGGGSLAYRLQHTHCTGTTYSTLAHCWPSSSFESKTAITTWSFQGPSRYPATGSFLVRARDPPQSCQPALEMESPLSLNVGAWRGGKSYRIENFTCIQLACTVVLYGVTKWKWMNEFYLGFN